MFTFKPGILPQAPRRQTPYPESVASAFTSANQIGNPDGKLLEELSKNFTYWQYVAIRLIADRCAAQTPQIGVVQLDDDGRQRTQRQAADRDRRTWRPRGVQSAYVQSAYGLDLAEGERFVKLDRSHPLQRLAANPNPIDTWCDFVFETVMFDRLMSRYYWWIIPNGLGVPAEVWNLPPQWVHPIYGQGGQTGWRVDSADGSVTFEVPTAEILERKGKSPRGKQYTTSALAAGSQWVDNVTSIAQAHHELFARGVMPSWVVHLDDNAPTGKGQSGDAMDVVERIKLKLMKRSGGGTKHIHEPMVIPHGATATPVTRSHDEMGFGDSKDQSRDENLALQGTSRTVAGMNEDVNRATAFEARKNFAENTLDPQLVRVATSLAILSGMYDDRIVVFYESTAPQDPEELRADRELRFRTGQASPDELAIEAGHEPLGTPLTESRWIPAGFQPLDPELVTVPAVEPDDTAGDDEPPDDDGDE